MHLPATCSCKEGSSSIFQKANELWPADERAEPLPDLAKLSVCGQGEAKEVQLQWQSAAS